MSEWQHPKRTGKAAVFKSYRSGAGHGGARAGAGAKSRAEIFRVDFLERKFEAAAGEAFGAWLQEWLAAIDDRRLLCPVCGGRTLNALHPRGLCGIAYRGLDLTASDTQRALRTKSTRSRKIVEPAAPPVEMVVRAVRRWMSQCEFAMFGFIELGGTKSGLRGALGQLNTHAHLLARGWLCEIEQARMHWPLGHAHGGKAVVGRTLYRLDSLEDDSEGELLEAHLPDSATPLVRMRALYAAKHAGKQSGGIDLLPVLRKNVGCGGVEVL